MKRKGRERYKHKPSLQQSISCQKLTFDDDDEELFKYFNNCSYTWVDREKILRTIEQISKQYFKQL